MPLDRFAAAMSLTFASCMGMAAELPTAGPLDSRVRFVDYKPEAVTLVNVQRGVVTRIVLGREEKIATAGSGFFADCQKPEAEWCIRAEAGSNQIWIKPRDGATRNNVEVSTDRGEYSFELRVTESHPSVGSGSRLARTRSDSEPMYRVVFRYPEDRRTATAAAANTRAQLSLALTTPQQPAKVDDAAVLQSRLAESSPTPSNWAYSMQVLAGSDELIPSVAFDDGRFTYFGFGANRDVPTVFMVDGTGEESMVPFHMAGDLLVVQRTARRFVLRLGAAAVAPPPVVGSAVAAGAQAWLPAARERIACMVWR